MTVPLSPTRPTLSAKTKSKLDALLASSALELPGCFFEVVSAEGTLYSGRAGRVDVLRPLEEEGNQVDEKTVLSFFSTTKLLTSIAILQLIDRGLLSLDTNASTYLPELATPGLKILTGVDPTTGGPTFGTSDVPITIAHLLSQTSGHGAEFSNPSLLAFKRSLPPHSPIRGYIMSCALAPLLGVPPCYPAGQTFEYGNAAEWLGLLISRLTGTTLEEHFQTNIFEPLGLGGECSFYSWRTEEYKARVMPLRYWDKEKGLFEVLEGQMDGLKMPRETADIEHPAAGGGIYCTPRAYSQILQTLLLPPPTPTSPAHPLSLSATSLNSLFTGTLPDSARPGLALMAPLVRPGLPPHSSPNWSTGLCIFPDRKVDAAEDGGKEWGSLEGMAGWGGAGNTTFGVDRKAGVAWVWSSNLLAPSDARADEGVARCERALYEGLGY